MVGATVEVEDFDQRPAARCSLVVDPAAGRRRARHLSSQESVPPRREHLQHALIGESGCRRCGAHGRASTKPHQRRTDEMVRDLRLLASRGARRVSPTVSSPSSAEQLEDPHPPSGRPAPRKVYFRNQIAPTQRDWETKRGLEQRWHRISLISERK